MHVLLPVAFAAVAFAAASPLASAPPATLQYEIVSLRDHDPAAFTQGLELDEQGRLFESTGRRGSSTLREVDPETGEVLRSRALPDRHFGEGITLVGDRIVGLTYQAGIATAYDLETFEPLETFEYEGQGWGLCFDDERLVMTNGGAELFFRDPHTFEFIDSVTVTLGGEPLRRLNELECVGDVIWANVWKEDRIVRIDPATGVVTGELDLFEMIEPYPPDDGADVLNGIAYDAASDTFLVTGKWWPQVVEIRISDPASDDGAGEPAS